jgi:hypothetical protein
MAGPIPTLKAPTSVAVVTRNFMAPPFPVLLPYRLLLCRLPPIGGAAGRHSMPRKIYLQPVAFGVYGFA